MEKIGIIEIIPIKDENNTPGVAISSFANPEGEFSMLQDLEELMKDEKNHPHIKPLFLPKVSVTVYGKKTDNKCYIDSYEIYSFYTPEQTQKIFYAARNLLEPSYLPS